MWCVVLVLVSVVGGQVCDDNAWFHTAELLGKSDGSFTFTYVISGAVRSTRAVIQARIRPADPFAQDSIVGMVKVGTKKSLKEPVVVINVTAYRDTWTNYRERPGDWAARAILENLTPGTRYYYQFYAPNGFASDLGQFKTLQDSSKTTAVKIVHWSCADRPPHSVGTAMYNERADFAIGYVHPFKIKIGEWCPEIRGDLSNFLVSQEWRYNLWR